MVDQTTSPWWNDDDQLLAALDRAVHPAEEVPASFLQAGHSCYAWHLIEAELAALAYDSAVDTSELALTRAESAALRALTFEASNVTFELEIMPDGLAGQLVPPQAGPLQLVSNSGETTDIQTNADGYFRIRPIPTTPFRLRCLLTNGRVVSTDQITL
jgi:hypothetical protein